MTLRTLNYGNYGIFLIMGNAGFCPSTVCPSHPRLICKAYKGPYITIAAGMMCFSLRFLRYPRRESSVSVEAFKVHNLIEPFRGALKPIKASLHEIPSCPRVDFGGIS